MLPAITVRYSEWVNAIVRELRERYERAGYEVVERRGEDAFPFEVDFGPLYRPALLARRGGQHHVVEVRDRPGSLRTMIEIADEIRPHPNWYVHLVTPEDVIPHEVPERQHQLPAWHQLESSFDELTRTGASLPGPVRLLALWAVLESALRRLSLDNGYLVELLEVTRVIGTLHFHGEIPYDSYEPLLAAHRVHRRVRHGYATPDEDVADAVRVVAEWLPQLVPSRADRAA